MRVVMFYHSLLSDWNHGNAHFLRGIVSELLAEVMTFASGSRGTPGACRTCSMRTASSRCAISWRRIPI